MEGYKGIPGFVIEDDDGKVIVANPGQQAGGRRVYKDGTQQDRSEVKRKGGTHDYLLRAPKGLWVAFKRKCDNEGLTIRGALLFLVKDWTMGKIEIEDLETRMDL